MNECFAIFDYLSIGLGIFSDVRIEHCTVVRRQLGSYQFQVP